MSYLETCFSSKPMPLIIWIQYIPPRDILSRDHFLWLILLWCCLKMYIVGEETGKTFTALRCFFYLCLAVHLKVHNVPPKLAGVGTLLPPSKCLLLEDFLYPFTLIKSFLHKALNDWGCIFGPRVNSSPLETMNLTPFTVSYQQHIDLWITFVDNEPS